MNKDKLDYIYNYIMDEVEIAYANVVANAVNKLVSRKIEVGNPAITTDYTQGYKAGTIKVINNNDNTNYYFMTVDEKGCIDCIIINEKTYRERAASPDWAVYFILMHIGLKNIGAYHIHEGHLVRAVRCRGGKIRLKQIVDYGKKNLNDAANHALGEGQAIYTMHKCTCGTCIFYIQGETKGMNCPSCNKHVSFEV
jgi:hypothetical protein